MQEETARQSAGQQKCASCGGEVVFDPAHQTLHCLFCGHKMNIVIKTGAIKEYDFKTAENTANLDWGSVKRVLHCNNCGADTVVDEGAKAHQCAFCGSAHIIDQESSAGIAPESLVPFKVGKNDAIENFTGWIKKRFFAPGALKQNYRKEGISGAYIPYWTYDADSESNYRVEAGTHYYENETYTEMKDGKQVTRQRRVRHTRWRRVQGDFNRHFDDWLVNASKNVDDKLIKKIEPFNLNDLVQYQPEFLAGFLAERYSIGLKEGWEKARQGIDQELRNEITRFINADEVRNLGVNTVYNNIKFKHMLLPVWISSYSYGNKVYRFMVNGQTGKVSGESPVSVGKIVGLVAAVLAVIGIIIVVAT